MNRLYKIATYIFLFFSISTTLKSQDLSKKPTKTFTDYWVDGKPKYLYVASGINIYGGDCTISYMLKFKK